MGLFKFPMPNAAAGFKLNKVSVPKLRSRVFTEGVYLDQTKARIDITPTWAKWTLIELLGPGGVTGNGSVGGCGYDIIVPAKIGQTYDMTSIGTTIVYCVANFVFPHGSNILYCQTNGSGRYASPRIKYNGGDSTPTIPQYGAYGDSAAQNPSAYYTTYGCGGGGRLAGYLSYPDPTLHACQGYGGGECYNSSYNWRARGSGVICITHAEYKEQLITFLNAHYLELWGKDWRDIP